MAVGKLAVDTFSLYNLLKIFGWLVGWCDLFHLFVFPWYIIISTLQPV